jgi:2-C-methyl-D-erythritol 2,4-cyclodiphosphate synthase
VAGADNAEPPMSLPAMQAALARTLGVAPAAVSVKAKTNAGLDAAGRGEAIIAQAVI